MLARRLQQSANRFVFWWGKCNENVVEESSFLPEAVQGCFAVLDYMVEANLLSKTLD